MTWLAGAPSRPRSGRAAAAMVRSSERAARFVRSTTPPGRLRRYLVDALLYPSDVVKVVTQHRDFFGSPPRLVRPTHYADMMVRGKLFGRRRRHIEYADKLAVRNHVANVIGAEHLNEVLWVGDRLLDLPIETLPRSFVVKSNNGSGTNMFVDDSSEFDLEEADRVAQEWLRNDHSVHHAEWQYRWIEPRLFVERSLVRDGAVPIDYKFHCIGGRVEIVEVVLDRFTATTYQLRNRDFELLPVEFEIVGGQTRSDRDVPRPESYDRMVLMAERLAAPERFLRVDFYDVDGPVFGELTLHPDSGVVRASPPEWDRLLLSRYRAARRGPSWTRSDDDGITAR